MYCFVWHQVDRVSDRYHSEGSIMIIAESIEAARSLWTEPSDCNRWEEDRTVFNSEPDYQWRILDAEPKVLVFPDAGCC